ncbi:MAG: hypothetical protein ACLSD7_05580 [Coprococcus phoceensis]
MLETLVENQIIFYAMGAGAAIGVLSKLIAHFTLRRMVKAASRMSKSNHKLMRLVRAKFEHASMVSDKVQNVEAFVKKYVYEYRVFGIRLHTFRNLEKKTIWIVAVLGTAGTVAVYYLYGLEEQVFQYAAWTGIGAVILCMVHILSDENYYQQMAENYMIDYLENVCAHRYAKLYKEKNVSQTSVLEMEETFSRRLRKKWSWQRWKKFRKSRFPSRNRYMPWSAKNQQKKKKMQWKKKDCRKCRCAGF